MPTTEPMTGVEVARAVTRIEAALLTISTKLDDKINNQTLHDFKQDSIRKDSEQDKALEDVEKKIDKLIWSITGTALTAVGGLFLALANRGIMQ